MSSIVRRAGSKLLKFIKDASDPAAVANEFQLYSKDDGGGVTQLWGRSDDGTIHQITPKDAGAGREIVSEVWSQNDVAASQTDVDLSAQVSQLFDTFKAVRAGSITGLSTRFTEAITDATGSSAVVTVTVNGTPGTLSIAHDSGSNASGGEATQATGVDTFVAGDLLGIQITTLGTFAPITTDLEAWLEIDT